MSSRASAYPPCCPTCGGDARACGHPVDVLARNVRLCAPAIAGEAFAGPSVENFDLEQTIEADLAAAAAPIALDVHAIARSLWNARPSDYLTNTAARNVWYASVSALSDTIEAIHPGTNLSEFFDIAGVPS